MARSIRRAAAAVPGIAAALLPNVACPACWPVYAGVLSSLGIGSLMNGPYFFLILVMLLGTSLVSLGYKATVRRGYVPLMLGLLGSLTILAGKWFEAPSVFQWSGAAALIAASIWNAWPIKQTDDEDRCTSCDCNNQSANGREKVP